MYLPPPTFDFGTWWGACPERKPKDRFFARLASEIFLSSLQTEFVQRTARNNRGPWSSFEPWATRTHSRVNYRKFPLAINPRQSHTA